MCIYTYSQATTSAMFPFLVLSITCDLKKIVTIITHEIKVCICNHVDCISKKKFLILVLGSFKSGNCDIVRLMLIFFSCLHFFIFVCTCLESGRNDNLTLSFCMWVCSFH